jgi:hypothetical protein
VKSAASTRGHAENGGGFESRPHCLRCRRALREAGRKNAATRRGRAPVLRRLPPRDDSLLVTGALPLHELRRHGRQPRREEGRLPVVRALPPSDVQERHEAAAPALAMSRVRRDLRERVFALRARARRRRPRMSPVVSQVPPCRKGGRAGQVYVRDMQGDIHGLDDALPPASQHRAPGLRRLPTTEAAHRKQGQAVFSLRVLPQGEARAPLRPCEGRRTLEADRRRAAPHPPGRRARPPRAINHARHTRGEARAARASARRPARLRASGARHRARPLQVYLALGADARRA